MNTTDNESKINSFFESNESESVGDRFVNALMLETQTAGLLWQFEYGPGSPAHCVCEGRKLVLIPYLDDPETDRYTLISIDMTTGARYYVIGTTSRRDHPDQLRDLYQDITESLQDCNREAAIKHMEIFLRKSAERQCLYAILDSIKLLQTTIANLMQNL